jgi:hypothetical protein
VLERKGIKKPRKKFKKPEKVPIEADEITVTTGKYTS